MIRLDLAGDGSGAQLQEETAPAPHWHFLFLAMVEFCMVFIRPGGKGLFAFLDLGRSAPRFLSVALVIYLAETLYIIWGFCLTDRGRRFVNGAASSWPPRAGDILSGVTLGVGLMIGSIVIGTLLPGGHRRRFSFVKTGLDHLLLLVVYIVGSISEEIEFRGYFLQQLAVLTRSTSVAVVLQGIFFVFVHGPGQGLAGYLTRFAIGIALGLVAVARKSLWPSMTAHLLINMTVFIVELH